MANNNNLIVKELPNIEYDRELLVPEVIERKKWNLIYIRLAILGIFISILFSSIVKVIESQKRDIATQAVTYCDLKPKINKLKEIGQNLNISNMLVSQFMLENLFFVDAKNFEIINSFKSFFSSKEVQGIVGSFIINSINLSPEGGGNEEISKIGIKIEGKYTSFTDLSNMISILNKMIPVVVIEKIDFAKGNSVTFKGFLYNFNKNIFTYQYGKKYEEINDILKKKEVYQKNKMVLKELLKDKDLLLEKMGITEIFNCKQYEDILKINKLKDFKKKEIEMCKDIEFLVNKNQEELKQKFESFIKKTSTNSNINVIPPKIDYSEADLGINCSDYGFMSF